MAHNQDALRIRSRLTCNSQLIGTGKREWGGGWGVGKEGQGDVGCVTINLPDPPT